MKKITYELPLSLRDSLEITRDMWDWLAENPGKYKNDYLRQLEVKLPSMHSDCACCEYTKGLDSERLVKCNLCPLASLWVRDYMICDTMSNSPYKLWWLNQSHPTAAKQIADAAREELRKLDEQELLNKTALNLYKEEKKQEPPLKWQAEREAEKQGKVIQFRDKIFYTEWTDIVSPSWLDGPEYRIKPTSKYRAWKPEEVPVGALIRTKFKPELIAVILRVTITDRIGPKVILNQNYPNISDYINDLFTYHGGYNGDAAEYSLDQGKTWLPCGVLLDEE